MPTTLNRYIHTNITKLNPEELPLDVEYHFTATGQAQQQQYSVNGGYWHDIDDSLDASHAIVDGTEVPIGARTQVQLRSTGRSVNATYVISDSPPDYPGRRAYWLIINDM